jgi:hypothetical protein
MDDLTQSLNPLIDAALVLGAVGTVAMAIIEFVKAVVRWRMRLHRYSIDRWLSDVPLSPVNRSREDRMKGFVTEELAIWRGISVMPPNRADVKRELLALLAGGDQNAEAWYDQPTGRLFTRMGQAAQLAVDFPERYPEFYGFLTENAGVEDDGRDAMRWPELAPQLRSPGIPLGEARNGCEHGEDGDDAVAIRSRLGNLVAARVETVQNWSEWRSARSNQFMAFALAAGLYLWIDGQSRGLSMTTLGMAVVAGMMAPFAKDLAHRLAGARISQKG